MHRKPKSIAAFARAKRTVETESARLNLCIVNVAASARIDRAVETLRPLGRIGLGSRIHLVGLDPTNDH